jgi:hypothetical protein
MTIIDSLNIVTSTAVSENEAFFIPNIPGLSFVDGELRVAELVTRKGHTVVAFRSLTESEKRLFGRITNLSTD